MAVIQINLDDKATEGLKALQGQLSDAATATDELQQSAEKLSEEQERQVMVIHESRAAYSQMADSTINLATASVHLTTVVAEHAMAWEKLGLSLLSYGGMALIDATKNAIGWYVAGSAAVKVVNAWRGEADEAAEATNRMADRIQWAGVMSLKATAYVTGFGTAYTAARLAMVPLDAVLARTGERFDEFGQKSTNFDRTSKAVNDLTNDVTRNLATGLMELPAYYGRLVGLDKAWQEIDKSVTRASDNFVENVGHVRRLAEQMDLVAESTEKFDNYVRRTADDFERLSALTGKWGAQDEFEKRKKAAQDYAEKLGELSHFINADMQVQRSESEQSLTAAIGRIDTEMQKRTQAAGMAAAANKFTQADAIKHEAEMDALRQVRATREQQLDSLLKSLPETRLRLEAEEMRRHVEQTRASYDERAKVAEEYYDRLQKLNDTDAQIRRRAILDARNEFMADIEARVKIAQEQRLADVESSKASDTEKAAQRRQIEATSRQEMLQLRIAQIKEQRDQALGMLRAETQDAIERAKTTKEREEAELKAEIERRKIVASAERDAAKAQTEFNRTELTKQAADRRAAAADAVKVEKDKADAIKKQREETLEKAGVKGQDLLNMGSRRDVLQSLQDNARQAARQKAAADNVGLFREAQGDSGGEARRRYDRLLKQAQDEAAKQATRDFNRGQTDPQQMAQAQTQAANKQLGALQASGKLSDTSVQAMRELLQATATEQARTDALQRQVEQITKEAAALRGNAQQQVQRQKAQGNAL